MATKSTCQTILDYRDASQETKDSTSFVLRKYCSGCHALGDLNFIPTSSTDENWRFLFTGPTKVPGKSWSELIQRVLSWPTADAPAYGQLMDPKNGKDWMPKGIKRINIHDDQFLPSDDPDGIATNPRKYILETLGRFK